MATYELIQEDTQGFNIVGGALHPECIYIIAEERFDETKHGKTADFYSFIGDFNIYLYKPWLMEKSNDWQETYYNNIAEITNIVTIPHKNIAFLGICSENGTVFKQNSPRDDIDDFQAMYQALEARGRINDLCVIDDEIYACSSGGAVYKRITDREWQEIALTTTKHFFSNDKFSNGFNCIDGFSADEIYAGGEKGILWICDKGKWQPIDLPYNKDIEQIACTPDGYVYLNCRWKILKGRKDNWQIIDIDNHLPPSMGIAKMSWFKGSVYLLPDAASATGLFKLNNGSIEKVPVEIPIPSGTNNMVANDDLLMITGNDEVIIFNGERWFVVFDKNQSEEELRQQGIFYDPRKL